MTADLSTSALIDTHCHLTDPAFESDLDEVLSQAHAVGVQRIVNIGTNVEDSRTGLELAQSLDQVYVSVGVHPNHCQEQPVDYLHQLEQLAKHPKTVALGEIGLDFHWKRASRDKQHSFFEAQLDLAAQAGLPVLVHCREAMPEVLDCLENWYHSIRYVDTPLASRPYAGVLHSFSGNEEDARRACKMNFLLGLGGPVTFKNAKELHALVPRLGLSTLILETDAPYLSPHPFRGKRNEPARIPLICQRIAQLMGQSAETVAESTTANAFRLFGWPAK